MAFKGRARLKSKLRSIPPKVRRAVREQMKVNGDELVDMQRRLAPVDDGDLKASIKARDVSSATRIGVRISAGNAKVHYARFVEFGTASREAEPERRNRNYKRTVVMIKARAAYGGRPARPFFWPSYRSLRKKFKSRVSRVAKKAALEAVK